MRNRKATLIQLSKILILLVGCRVGVLIADDQPEKAREEMSRAEIDVRNNAEASAPSNASPAALANELKEMRELIDGQRKQIEKLQSALEQQQQKLDQLISTLGTKSAPKLASAGTTVSPALKAPETPVVQEKMGNVELMKDELEAAADGASQVTQRLTKLESVVAANRKETDAKAKQLGNFAFSGDVRVRYEPFFQEGALDRHRERIRLRFNVTGKLSDEFSGGFSLATGTLDDPVSTNQTFTSFLNRKNFGVDKAWITYKPNYAKSLKLDAGKFAYPWYRTPLTFDNDVNPEGFAETLSFDLKSSAIKNITVVGFQLPINEVTSGYDSFILGGQIQAQFRINSKARLGLYGAGININRADSIAVNLANGTLKPSLPNSNTYRYNSSGTVIGYASKFAYLDAIMKLELDTNPRFPTTIQFNFVNNVRGSRERSGYWADVTFGKQKEAGDLQFGYSFIRVEKDAVIGAWNESDQRSSTNVRNHRLQFAYMFKQNFTGQFTAWIGRLANPPDNADLVPPGVRAACTGGIVSDCRDPYLKRLQLDVTYKF
jgi:hypothetical protein